MFWKLFSIVTLYDPFSWLGYPVDEAGRSMDKDRDRERDSKRIIDPIRCAAGADVKTFKREMTAQKPPVPFVVDMLRTISEDDYARKKLHVELTPEKRKTATTIVRTNTLLLVSVFALIGMGLMADEIIKGGTLVPVSESDITCYTKYFNVAKGDLYWRIITDARRAGMMSQPPAPVNLPSMQIILKEIAMLGSTTAVISDIRHGFFQWPINPYLQRFFGIACGATFAIMKCLPMGWCHSPRFQQCGAWGLIIRCKKGQPRLGLTEPDGKTPKQWGHDPPQLCFHYWNKMRGK